MSEIANAKPGLKNDEATRKAPGGRSAAQIRLPSVDRVLRTPSGVVATDRFGHEAAVDYIRKAVARLREAVRAGAMEAPDAETIATGALRLLEQDSLPSLRRVFNLTGTVLHTNLGRAVLPEAAILAAADAMR